jgi:hypothetical protein
MKSKRAPDEMNMDFLMDTVTNVVGILILILVLNTLNIKRAVQRIRELDPSQFGVTAEQLAEMQETAQQTREVVKELQNKTFGVDVQLEQDRQTLFETRKELIELRRTMPPPPPPDTKQQELQQVVQQREQKQKELEEQLAKLDEELQQVQSELDHIPEVAAPPPKIVRLPNPREAPKGAQPILFICQEGRLLFFAPEELKDRVTKRVQYLLRPLLAKAGAGGEIDCQKLVETYNKDAISDAEFRTRLVVENFNLVLIYEFRGAGETSERLRSPSSRYQAMLRRMDPAKNYARFLVWPDSFDVYVEARNLADERGVLAGWEPQTETFQWKIPLGIAVSCQGKPKPPPPKPAPPKPEQPGPPPPPLPNDAVD